MMEIVAENSGLLMQIIQPQNRKNVTQATAKNALQIKPIQVRADLLKI